MNRIYETFTQVEVPPNQLMETMGHAFIQIIEAHRDEFIMVIQAHAISEPAIRDYVREQFQIIYEAIIVKFKSAGILNAEEAASQFIGIGLLITVSEVLDLPKLLCFKSK